MGQAIRLASNFVVLDFREMPTLCSPARVVMRLSV